MARTLQYAQCPESSSMASKRAYAALMIAEEHTSTDHANRQKQRVLEPRMPSVPMPVSAGYRFDSSLSYRTMTSIPATKQRVLLPMPPKEPQTKHKLTCFFDLPAELRLEIYHLVLKDVRLHILPDLASNSADYKNPHALVRTSHQVRNEVLPIIHARCPINVVTLDFNFDGLLKWMGRLPPDQEANLCKNKNMTINLITTSHEIKGTSSNSAKNSLSLGRWLRLRADRYRPQPEWKYRGPKPDSKTIMDMKRRARRINRPLEKAELSHMLRSLGAPLTTLAVDEATSSSPSPDSG